MGSPITHDHPSGGGMVRRLILVVGLLGTVSYLDHLFSAFLPVSHLYYLPILLAAVFFGYAGGLGAALAAIGLYHATHFVFAGAPQPWDETDLLRLVLFIAVGATTAKLANDRRRMARLAGDLETRNQELSSLNARLEELSQARADFVAVASHELRTPLTAIMGSAALVVDRPAMESERRNRLLRHVYDASARLQNTVDSLLDAALIESGRFTLRRERVVLGDLLQECKGTFPAIGDDRIRLPEQTPGIIVNGDRTRLLQVLVNLVANAFKYSPAGTPVEISVAMNGGRVEVAVADRGYGIAAEDLPHIFERYYRAADGRIRASRGAGLGLSVSRDIVRAHGGELTVRSKLGEGTTFTLALTGAELGIPADDPALHVCRRTG